MLPLRPLFLIQIVARFSSRLSRYSAGPLGAIVGCRHQVVGQEEEVVDLVVGGQEALTLSGRLEPLHLAFSSSGRLVRIFRPVVEPLVLAVLDAGHDLLLRRAV